MIIFALLSICGSSTEQIAQGPVLTGVKGLTSVEAKVGGHRLTLLIDSGVDSTVLTPRAYCQVTGKSLPDGMSEDGVESESEFDLQLGGVSIGRTRITGWNLPILRQPIDNLRVDGLLGRDILMDRVCVIDYLTRRFRVFKANTSPETLASVYSAYGAMFRPGRGGTVEDGYTISVSSGNWQGWMQLDTGASQLAIQQDVITRIPHIRVGSNEVASPLGSARRDVVLLSSLDAGITLPFPRGTLTYRTDIGGGVVSPNTLGLWAIALLPTGHVGFWASSDPDVRITGALRRIFGLPLNARKGRLYLMDTRAGALGREREIISLQGKPAEYWLRVVKDNVPSARSKLFDLAWDAQGARILTIRGDKGLEQIKCFAGSGG
jgi:hypothetical protein